MYSPILLPRRKLLHDRFRTALEFGTGGLRGVIAAGTNRMNRYVVRHTTAGLADYIASFGLAAMARGVVIAHDCRHGSPEFAREAALTLNARGIVAYLWPDLRPTPMLSFAVRELGTIAGIVITASHNPKEYNGYKVYWEDGGQVPPERASAIAACIRAIADITTVQPMDQAQAKAQGLLRPVLETVDRAYLDQIIGLATTPAADRANCHVLYTPLHGTGSRLVRQALTLALAQAAAEQPDAWPPTPMPIGSACWPGIATVAISF